MLDHISLDPELVEEAKELIERKELLELERRYLCEKLARVNLKLHVLGREQDAWLASVAGDRGVPLESLKGAVVSVVDAKLHLAACSKQAS